MTQTKLRLLAKTRRMSSSGSLTEWVSAENPLTFQRLGRGFVGLGQIERMTFKGPGRFQEANVAWKKLVAEAEIDNPLDTPGTGLVCFGTFSFDDFSNQESVLIIPRVIIGREGSNSWRTDISVAGSSRDKPVSEHSKLVGLEPIQWVAGLMSEKDYVTEVTKLIPEIQSGRLDKVVLARDLIARAPAIKDWRQAISHLVETYPDCQTFAIDGFLGSSPETLARVEKGKLSLRVLAGSSARGSSPAEDRMRSEELITSGKDNDEHRYAVNGVVESLSRLTPHVVADQRPFSIKLANVWHLATDIAAALPGGISSLDVVSALHPTAAVAGSPSSEAVKLISSCEPFDRGRYAGPVGWMDSSGDGDWSIALRCAQWSDSGTITAYAGAGIVADSDPQSELLETQLKFNPILSAFGSKPS